MTRRVLVVDDHPSFRGFARRLLEAAGYDVVGEAGDGREALERAAELAPDVVLLDVLLPDTTGFEVAEGLASLSRPPAVILTSSRREEDLADQLGRTRARGFITKAELSPEAIDRLVEA